MANATKDTPVGRAPPISTEEHHLRVLSDDIGRFHDVVGEIGAVVREGGGALEEHETRALAELGRAHADLSHDVARAFEALAREQLALRLQQQETRRDLVAMGAEVKRGRIKVRHVVLAVAAAALAGAGAITGAIPLLGGAAVTLVTLIAWDVRRGRTRV